MARGSRHHVRAKTGSCTAAQYGDRLPIGASPCAAVPPPPKAMHPPQPSIFVSVASFCDPLLLHTVRDGAAKAEHPGRICWAVVDQHPESRQEALREVLGGSTMRYLHLHPLHSRGCSWARSLVATLFQGEDHVLQIDSHTCFEPGWDLELLRQLAELRLRCAKPVISIYPHGFEWVNGQAVTNPPGDPEEVLVFQSVPEARLSDDQLSLMFRAVGTAAAEPVEGFHLAGGFLFADGAFIHEVPYDPRLYFHGDEQSLALRAYTHGWTIFHPRKIPLYHHYKPAGQAHDTQHWNPQWESARDFSHSQLTQAAHERLRDLVDGRGELGVYGLGAQRTLQSFAAASGIDYAQRRLRPPIGPVGDADPQSAVVHVVELNPHHPRPYVFTDCARNLVELLRSSGLRSVHTVNAIPAEGQMLVLGWSPQWLDDHRAHLDPQRTILFNSEPLDSSERIGGLDRLEAMRPWLVADIHEANLRLMRNRWGDEHRAMGLQIAPQPTLGQRVADRPDPWVDVVMVGSSSPRRSQALKDLQDAGLTVRHIEGAYGEELMPWLQRARLMVHVHHGQGRQFPLLRMLRPVAMGLPVVCESSLCEAPHDWSSSGMVFCERQDLVARCQALLADERQRMATAAACRAYAQALGIGWRWGVPTEPRGIAPQGWPGR